MTVIALVRFDDVGGGAAAMSRAWPDQYARVIVARRGISKITADQIAWRWATKLTDGGRWILRDHTTPQARTA
jgi:hypothetical protein